MRVLFVDDEPRVLEALERMVLELVDDWDVRCSPSAEAALVELGTATFDCVVSDMRMPGADGASLLHEVHLRHPHVTRFVLSGQTEQEAAMRALRVAHQFITKPCKAVVLVASIQRALGLQELVRSAHLRSLAGAVEWLPSLPAHVRELTHLLDDPHADVVAVGEIVARDPAMTAKVLQIVNSAFFARGQTVVDARVAVSRLGLDVVRAAALGSRPAVEAVEAVVAVVAAEGESERESASLAEDQVAVLQRKALLAANLASSQVAAPLKREAFTAALLCDVGQLVLGRDAVAEHRSALALVEREGVSLDVAEQRIFGATHAEIGAYVLGLWGLPPSIVDAVAHHHRPELARREVAELAAAVHAAHVEAAAATGATTGRELL